MAERRAKMALPRDDPHIATGHQKMMKGARKWACFDPPLQIHTVLGGANSFFFNFHPYLKKISNFDLCVLKGVKPPTSV